MISYTTTKGPKMKRFIGAVKIGIFWTKKDGIRHGIKSARHYHYWYTRTGW